MPDMNVRASLTVGEVVIEATVVDNETTRDFISLLPLTPHMSDVFGREKYARSPQALSEGGGHRLTYTVRDVPYWPPSRDLAIFYADDGRRAIPSPGITVIGTIDSGLDSIASAGDDFQMTIERND